MKAGIEFDPNKTYGCYHDYMPEHYLPYNRSRDHNDIFVRSGHRHSAYLEQLARQMRMKLLVPQVRSFMPREHRHRVRFTHEVMDSGANRVGWIYEPEKKHIQVEAAG